MSNIQLYFAIGIPAFIFLASMAVNGIVFTLILNRISSIDTRLNSMAGKLAEMDARLSRLEDRWPSR